MLLSTLQTVVVALAPSGGQLQARRNAWSGLTACAARSRARREADAAVDAAWDAVSLRTGTHSGR